MSKYSIDTSVGHPIGETFDAARLYFMRLGYSVTGAAEPFHISFSRPGAPGSILLPSDEIARHHTMHIDLIDQGTATHLVFNFVCPSSAVGWSRKGRGKVDEMFSGLARSIPEITKELAPHRSTKVAVQVIKVRCRGCGALNEEDSKYCKACGSAL